MDGQTFDPLQNGFVFSRAQVQAHIDRNRQLRSALEARHYDFDRKNFPETAEKVAA
jgi:hypothetical protein